MKQKMQGGEMWYWNEREKKWYRAAKRIASKKRKKRNVATEFKDSESAESLIAAEIERRKRLQGK